VCIALCTIVAHNIAQNRPDNFPSYPPDNHHCSDDVYLREGGVSGMVDGIDAVGEVSGGQPLQNGGSWTMLFFKIQPSSWH